MNKWLLRKKAERAIKELEPAKEKGSFKEKIGKIKLFSYYKYFSPVRYAFIKLGKWINEQHFGVLFLIVLITMFFAYLFAVKLWYLDWLTTMKSNYPSEVLLVVDKVLIEWNSAVVAVHWYLFSLMITWFVITANRMYCSSKPQVIPHNKRGL